MMKAWEQRIGKLMLGNGDRRTFEVVTAFDGVLEKTRPRSTSLKPWISATPTWPSNAGPKPKTSSSTPSATTSSANTPPTWSKNSSAAATHAGRSPPRPVADPAQEFMRPYYEHLFVLDAMRLIDLALSANDMMSAVKSSAEGPEGLRQQEAEAGALGAGRDFHETERIVYFRKDLNESHKNC